MITPYKVYQRRITDSNDEIDFEAICSVNRRLMTAWLQVSNPKITLLHLTLTQEESGPNMVKLGKQRRVFSLKRLAVACSSDISVLSRAFSTKLP